MARPNPRAGVRDIVLSLAVLLVPIVAIVWFFQTAPEEPHVAAVDWEPVVSTARTKAPYTVMAPKAVPAGWKATKAVWSSKGDRVGNGDTSPHDQLSLGFITDDTMHIAVLQTNAPEASTLAAITRQGVKTGTRDVEGVVWTTWLSPDERTRALSRTTPDGTVVVVSGDVDHDRLAVVVALLG